MKIRRLLFFTLLEILLAMGLLAIIGSITGYSIRRVYLEQQALNDMHATSELLTKAVNLMMLVNIDSEVHFFKINDIYHAKFVPKSGISALITPLLPKEPVMLKNIDAISFEDGIQKTVLSNEITLHFLSKGFVMNRGVLTLKSPHATGSFLLLGYPSQMTLIKGPPIKYPDDKTFQNFIQKTTEQTRQETVETS